MSDERGLTCLPLRKQGAGKRIMGEALQKFATILRPAPAEAGGEPTTRECAAAVIQLAIVLRDLAVATGYAEYATRITHAIIELDHPHRKEIER